MAASVEWAYCPNARLPISKASVLLVNFILETDPEADPGNVTSPRSKSDFEPSTWEVCAQDRVSWRCLVKSLVSNYVQGFIAQKIDKRKMRNERLENPPTTGEAFPCPHCSRTFHSRIAVVSHKRTHPRLRYHGLAPIK